MITPVELQSKNFKSGIGYVKKDIDSFIQELNEDYENLYKENKELKEQLRISSNTLAHYKSLEKDMQNALDLAKKAAEEIKHEARQTAAQIEEDARNKAMLIISDSNKELEYIQKKIYHLSSQYEEFVLQYKEIAAHQLEALDSQEFKLKISESALSLEDSENK